MGESDSCNIGCKNREYISLTPKYCFVFLQMFPKNRGKERPGLSVSRSDGFLVPKKPNRLVMFGRMPNFGQRKWWASSLAVSGFHGGSRSNHRISNRAPKLPVNHWKREKWGEDQICVCENIEYLQFQKNISCFSHVFPIQKWLFGVFSAPHVTRHEPWAFWFCRAGFRQANSKAVRLLGDPAGRSTGICNLQKCVH
jgi:hypothetical protein